MQPLPSSRARFGTLELNTNSRELHNGSQNILLQEQSYKLLLLLLLNGNEVTKREAIQNELWGSGTKVGFEGSINAIVRNLRRILDDSATDPKYIQTLPRQGYRLLVPVDWAPLLSTGNDGNGLAATAVPPVNGSLENITAGSVARRRGSRTLLISAVLLAAVALAAGILYYRSHRKNRLFTDKDSIVLADVDNSTGDPVFDGTLKQALSVQIEQTPALTLVPERKVNATLDFMAHTPSAPLTAELARQVCRRLGGTAMLAGSIARLGSDYVIGLKVVDCANGDVLAEALEQAASKETVLKALDAAAVSIRSKLGESLSSVRKYATPVEEATTPSLKALQAYSLGRKAQAERGETAALPFYKQAVALDPQFAMAYRSMAVVYSNLGENHDAAEAARKAYELRKNVSEREQLSIEASYHMYASGDLVKAAEMLELWQQAYPRDDTPYVNLGLIYALLGNWERAVEEDRAAVALDPNDVVNYSNLGYAYAGVNRLAEAEAVYKGAQNRKFEGESLLMNRYLLAFLQNDAAEMAQVAAAAIGKPGVEDLLLATEANTAAWFGKPRDARALSRQAMDSAQHAGATETAATYQATAAIYEAEWGNRKQARDQAIASLKLSDNRDERELAGLALARAGDSAEAEKIAAEFEKSFPSDTLIQRYWLPNIRAADALEHNDPTRAIELLKATNQIEFSVDSPLAPPYLRGQAYLKLGDGKAAAQEFQKLVDRPGLVANFPWGALARLGLARAYALDAAQDPAARDKARLAYQNFLTLWKDADPDIPIYKQAKAEYAKLK